MKSPACTSFRRDFRYYSLIFINFSLDPLSWLTDSMLSRPLHARVVTGPSKWLIYPLAEPITDLFLAQYTSPSIPYCSLENWGSTIIKITEVVHKLCFGNAWIVVRGRETVPVRSRNSPLQGHIFRVCGGDAVIDHGYGNPGM